MRTYSRIVFVLLFSGYLVSGCTGTKNSTSNEVPEQTNSAETTVQIDSSIVAVIGDNTISIEEFENEYARSLGRQNVADSLSQYEDFLERYVNFRLKVLAAKDAGFESDSTIQQELDAYRMNLARPRLLDKEVIDPLMRDIFQRIQTTVEASHILIRVEPGAPPEDTLAAYERMAAILDSINQGIDFGELAIRNSEDPSARATNQPGYKGHLGFFTTGQMVPEFENMAYTTQVGEVSPIFRTQFGYHILKVHNRQQAVPNIRVSHIMITPRGSDSTSTQEAISKLQEIKNRIEAGEDFDQLAREYSEHPQSAQRGGDIGWFSYYRPEMAPPGFHEGIFSIKEVGEISEIFQSAFGFHIAKLTDRQNLDSFEAIESQLRQYVNRLPRMREDEIRLAKRIREENRATIDSTAVMQIIEGIPADSLMLMLADGNLSAASLSAPIVTLGDSTYTMTDVIQFIRKNRPDYPGDSDQKVFHLLNDFLNEKAIDFEALTLADRDPEFKRLLTEFHNGLLLFKIMEDSVWNAASKDSLALVEYYDEHADKYHFPDRTRIFTFTSRSDSLLKELTKKLEEGTSLSVLQAELAEDSLKTIRLDTVYVADSTHSVYDEALGLQKGEFKGPILHNREFVVLINDGIDPAHAKSFQEARAEVISDYQKVLEERLINRLRNRYNARTFPEHLTGAFASSSKSEPVSLGH